MAFLSQNYDNERSQVNKVSVLKPMANGMSVLIQYNYNYKIHPAYTKIWARKHFKSARCDLVVQNCDALFKTHFVVALTAVEQIGQQINVDIK